MTIPTRSSRPAGAAQDDALHNFDIRYAPGHAFSGVAAGQGEVEVDESLPLGHAVNAGNDDSLLDGLAVRTASGDKAAFEEVYELTNGDLFRFVRGLCGNETVAEDLVANTYMRAWRSARRYRAGSNSYRRWLYRIARNQVIDHWKANQSTVSIREMDFASPADAEAGPNAAEVRWQVAKLLSTLTEAQREVVVLRYINNKSYEEIARLLGKREGAVRSQLLRALRHMRKVMTNAPS